MNNETEFVDLKPCPFCGGSAEIFHKADNVGYFAGSFSAHVECTNCQAKSETFLDDKLNSALSFATSYWNQRVDESKYPTTKERELYKKVAENASTIGFYEGFLEGLATHSKDEISERILKIIQDILDSVAER